MSHRPDLSKTARKVRSLTNAVALVDWLKLAGWSGVPVLVSRTGHGRLGAALDWEEDTWIVDPTAPTPLLVTTADEAIDGRMARVARTVARMSRGRAAIVIRTSTAGATIAACTGECSASTMWTSTFDRLDADGVVVWSSFEETTSSTVAAVRLVARIGRRALGRRFFRDVRRHVTELTHAWSGVESSADRRALSITLLCRLMFLYFVQRKGWLDGDPGFMAALVLDPAAESVYEERLRPLFFDALNRPPDRRGSGPRYRGVPFLNGGLFAPSEAEQRNPNATLDDAVVRALVDAVLERYRFVEREDIDGEVAVDPEMLGCVFEQLMCDEQRTRTGAFYTPPSLVHDTVDLALATLMECRVGAETWAAVERRDTIDSRTCTEVVAALDDLRILDPAVGTGAFLLGALQRLVDCRAHLQPGLPRAELARRIVGRNLYGVDISATAVTLCELRLWLAVAAEMSDGPGAHVQPLPNLSHHVRRGNVLTGTSVFAAFEGVPVPPDIMRRLERATEMFPTAVDRRKRELEEALRVAERELAVELLSTLLTRLEGEDLAERAPVRDLFGVEVTATRSQVASRRAREARITDVRRALADARSGDGTPTFDPHVHFASVVGRGGFDLVVGNPPWVRLADLPGSERRRVRGAYRWVAEAGGGRPFGAQPDLSVAFTERAVRLTTNGGVVALVVPTKLFTAGYGRALRAGLLRETDLVALRDLSGAGVSLFSADAYPGTIVARVGGGRGGQVAVDNGGSRFVVPTGMLAATPLPGAPWPLLGAEEMAVYRRLTGCAHTVGSQYELRMGIKTGANVAFVDLELEGLPIVPAIRGKDIQPMHAAPTTTLFLAHDPATGAVLPAESLGADLARWLGLFEDTVTRRADHRPTTAPWAVFRVRPGALGHRVAWRDISRQLVAAPVPPVEAGGPVALNSAYTLAVQSAAESLRVAAWLCALPARFVASAPADRALSGHRRFRAEAVARVPFPPCLQGDGGRASRAFDEAAANFAADAQSVEAQRRLDTAAAALLGMSDHEQTVMRRACSALGCA